MCVCVIETHLWKQLSWPPSPLPHPVPAVSQQLTALHLSSQPPTFPYLCSCLFVSTSPFPLSTHSFYLISLVVRFPLSIPSISFSIVSLVWLSCNFCSDITPSPSSSLPLLIWLLSWTTHLLLFFYKLTSFDYRYLHLTQSFSFILCLPLFMSILLPLSAPPTLLWQLCAVNKDVGQGLAHLDRQGCDKWASPQAGYQNQREWT